MIGLLLSNSKRFTYIARKDKNCTSKYKVQIDKLNNKAIVKEATIAFIGKGLGARAAVDRTRHPHSLLDIET